MFIKGKTKARARLGKPIVPIVVERRSLHMEEDTD